MARVPGTFSGSNGGSAGWIPDDIVWDEDNHPVIFQCSQHTEHHPACNGECGEPTELDTPSQVEILNEGRRYARAGMSFMGVPAAYQGKLPIPGISIELVDLFMWLKAAKKLIQSYCDVSEFEFEEAYRAEKIDFLRTVREANEEAVKQAELRSKMAIAEKPGLLGPDGQPFNK